jgi:hypothetical protein
MLSGTKERGGDLSGTRGGDPAGLLCADSWGDTAEDRVASTCSSGTVPASAVAAGLDFNISKEGIQSRATWTYMS